MHHIEGDLMEGIGIEESLDPLARGQLPAPVLRLDALLAPAEARRRSLR
jgi:hypothetical protein